MLSVASTTSILPLIKQVFLLRSCSITFFIVFGWTYSPINILLSVLPLIDNPLILPLTFATASTLMFSLSRISLHPVFTKEIAPNVTPFCFMSFTFKVNNTRM